MQFREQLTKPAEPVIKTLELDLTPDVRKKPVLDQEQLEAAAEAIAAEDDDEDEASDDV